MASPQLKLKSLHIKNFKSYKDAKIDFGDFNVVVGPNASGKTSLIEVFMLLQKIYIHKETNPFLDWWGYDNVVWKRQEKLPISVKMDFRACDHDISFETVFTGSGGKFRILKETLDFEGLLSLHNEGKYLELKYDEQFFDRVLQIADSEKEKSFQDGLLKDIERSGLDNLMEQRIKCKSNTIFEILQKPQSFQPFGDLYYFTVAGEINENSSHNSYRDKSSKRGSLIILTPHICGDPTFPIEFRFNAFFGRILDLKGLNIDEMRNPSRPKRDFDLLEDGSNLQNVLYNLFLKDNKIPERVANFIEYTFPGTTLKFELTQDGRVLLKISEDGLELNPPGISDGFYKVLTVLTAVETQPSLLIIDELENSLHPGTTDRILGELQSADFPVIVTTHSPAIVDMTNPKDLIVLQKNNEGESCAKRVENPEELRSKLQELGITLSEGWLYGKL